jgi:hypothetical protein
MLKFLTITLLVVIILSDCDSLNLQESQLTAECGNSNLNPSLVHGGNFSKDLETPW